MSVKPWKEVQAERTRDALLAEARDLFGRRGYVSAVLEEVVRATGMTRGAIYHHFKDKRALFEAVFERVLEEVAAEVAGAADPIPALLERLRAGDVRQISLVDGPYVLGQPEWSARMSAHLSPHVRGVVAAGDVPRRHVDGVARLLFAAIQEAALAGDEPAAERRRLDEALRWLLRRLDEEGG
jgi:AcrR family transcriptional regulator